MDPLVVAYGEGRRFAGVLQPGQRWVGVGCACFNAMHHLSSVGLRQGGRGEGGHASRARLWHVMRATTVAAAAAPLCRCVLHWDNADKARELVIRPTGRGWAWSGAFGLPEDELYFGLRIRNK